MGGEPVLEEEAVVISLISFVNALIMVLTIIVSHGGQHNCVREVFNKLLSNSCKSLLE